jgi:hypothetical protein
MKWDCDAALSVSSTAFHFLIKSSGCMPIKSTASRPGCAGQPMTMPIYDDVRAQ